MIHYLETILYENLTEEELISHARILILFVKKPEQKRLFLEILG